MHWCISLLLYYLKLDLEIGYIFSLVVLSDGNHERNVLSFLSNYLVKLAIIRFTINHVTLYFHHLVLAKLLNGEI